MLFWNGVTGKLRIPAAASVEEKVVKIYPLGEFIVIVATRKVFLLSSQTFQLLDCCSLASRVVDSKQHLLKLADQTVLEVSISAAAAAAAAAGKLQLLDASGEFTNDTSRGPLESSDWEALGSAQTITLKSNSVGGQVVSELPGKCEHFCRLGKYTLLGCWLESGQLFVTPLKLLERTTTSNSSALPFILWNEKQLFVHRAALYPGWLSLQRSEQFDVVDSQIGNISAVAASEDCMTLAVLNESGMAAVCDFTRRLWRPIHASSICQMAFLNNEFVIFSTKENNNNNSSSMYLISLSQPELYATPIPLQTALTFFACSGDGSLIVQQDEAVHAFSFTSRPSSRQIHFACTFSYSFTGKLKQAAVCNEYLYLLEDSCAAKLTIVAMSTGMITGQLTDVSCFLCVDDFLLVKKATTATWYLYWNSELLDLCCTADAIYTHLPGIVAITLSAPNFSLSAPISSSFLLPRMFRLTGQFRLLEKGGGIGGGDVLILEYLVLECREEPELLRKLDEFFARNSAFASAVIKCCRKVELAEAIRMFAHLSSFTPRKIVDLVGPEECLLFLPFLVNSFDYECKQAITDILKKLSGPALEQARSYLDAREVSLIL